jgi:hypothetical protein
MNKTEGFHYKEFEIVQKKQITLNRMNYNKKKKEKG